MFAICESPVGVLKAWESGNHHYEGGCGSEAIIPKMPTSLIWEI